jgi:hypothetical protein
MTWLDETIKRVADYDAARPRSVQAELGWSEVGGCRAYIGFRLDGAWPSDETDSWGAQRGTAIHEYLQAILAGPGIRTEVDTTYAGIPGHADLVVDAVSVTDIKTTKMANSVAWRSDPGTLWQKRVQAHGYAAGLVDAGDLPEDATVRLLVVPADGTFTDWWCYEEPFDRSLADAGAQRLAEVRERMAAGERLPKDKPYAWCESWCEFFSLCRAADDPKAGEAITDPELAAAVTAYGEANAVFSAAKKEKDRLAPLIRGLRGTAGDWRISLGVAGDNKEIPDEAAIRADYAARGEPLPMTTKPGDAARMRVTRIKKAGGGGR